MKHFYQSMISNIQQSNYKNTILKTAKILPYITFISYILLLIYELCFNHYLLLTSMLAPLSVFVFVTIIRKIFNRPRPHITYHFTPIASHKNSESFPSRHTACAFIIALTVFSIQPMAGILLLIVASCIAISRIMIGVHHFSDVIVGMLIAIIVWGITCSI